MRLGHLISGKIKSTFRRRKSLIACAALAASVALLAGCDVKSFIDPGEMGRYKKNALLVPILDKLDTGYEEDTEIFSNARDVQPSDLVIEGADYQIGKNDLVQITITDLVGPGVETVKTARVSESGNVNLPLVGEVHAEGLTELQLERGIADAYKNAQLIQNAQVSVQVAEARARTFSILGEQGSVAGSGEYAIVRSDFKLLDALVLAHDQGLPGIDYCFIIRKHPADNATTTAPSPAPAPTPGATTTPAAAPAAPGPDILAPHSGRYDLIAPGHPVLLQTSGAPANGNTTTGAPVVPAPQPLSLSPTTTPADATPATPPADSSGRYIIVDGKPVLVNTPTTAPANTAAPVATPAPTPTPTPAPTGVIAGLTPPTTESAPVTQPTSQPFRFAEPTGAGTEEVIRVPLAQLHAGELKYNVVIRPGDFILVPAPINGVYYIGGHANRAGVYQLAGQRVTLKQAIIAAGMLDQVAIPQRTDVIRRIGEDKEVFCRINLDAIFDGRAPDFFIKANDQIMVGTNLYAPFLAAVRGGFRISYGYGFVYDRNYAPAQEQPSQNQNVNVSRGTTVSG